ncbi:NUDIX hydrolase [Sinimarinibacterium flocculans]|uniref:NUDIX hydrolase n=1 Tax=Sinimarinibacterium flocculans TaxID=985250 RepID=UPI003511AD01
MNETETLHEGRFLALQRDGRWEYVARTNSSGAVFILAVTAARELLLVEQYRVPLRARTIELPAGMMGDEARFRGESLADAALRELEEETGYRGSRVESLTSGPVAAGLTSEMLHLVRVHDLQRVHDGGGVDGEDIVVHRVPLDDIDDWLVARTNEACLIEPRIYAALYFVMRAGLAGAGG